MHGAWTGFACATRFLTVLPVPRLPGLSGEAPDPTPWFPLVGLVLGLLLFGLRLILPGSDPGILSAVLVLTAWTALTGGLHEDGWADCADAALAPVGRARRLEILKDPRVGAHGLVAVVLLLLVRLAALTDGPAWALLVAPIVGRWAMALSLAYSRPLLSHGLGASLARRARPLAASGSAVAALGFALTISVISGPGRAAAFMIATTAASMVVAAGAGGGMGVFLQRRFGGLSGDGHGAVGLAAETAALVALTLGVAVGS